MLLTNQDDTQELLRGYLVRTSQNVSLERLIRVGNHRYAIHQLIGGEVLSPKREPGQVDEHSVVSLDCPPRNLLQFGENEPSRWQCRRRECYSIRHPRRPKPERVRGNRREFWVAGELGPYRIEVQHAAERAVQLVHGQGNLQREGNGSHPIVSGHETD